MPCDKRLVQTIKIMPYYVFNSLWSSLPFFSFSSNHARAFPYIWHTLIHHIEGWGDVCVCVCPCVCVCVCHSSAFSALFFFCPGAVFRAEKKWNNAKRLAVGKLKRVFQVASLLSRIGTIFDNTHLSCACVCVCGDLETEVPIQESQAKVRTLQRHQIHALPSTHTVAISTVREEESEQSNKDEQGTNPITFTVRTRLVVPKKKDHFTVQPR